MRVEIRVGKEVIEMEIERVFETIYEIADEFSPEIYDIVYNALITKSGEIKIKFTELDDEQKKVLNGLVKRFKIIIEDGYVKVEREMVGLVLMIIAKVAIPEDDDFTTDNPIFNIVVGLTQEYLNGKIKMKRNLIGKIRKCLKLAYPLKF
jgi:hypothetical protein